MSKISDAAKEVSQFSKGLTRCAVEGDMDALRGGLVIASAFVALTVIILNDMAKRPLVFLSRVLIGNYDPYKDLRPEAQAFINAWGVK